MVNGNIYHLLRSSTVLLKDNPSSGATLQITLFSDEQVVAVKIENMLTMGVKQTMLMRNEVHNKSTVSPVHETVSGLAIYINH